MLFDDTEIQWFSVTNREKFCKRKKEEGKRDWVKYRLCKFWLTDFNINDCHLIILKETQWFSTMRNKFFKDWKKIWDKILIVI